MTEPFSEVLVDVVGPLCRTSKGHEYCLTIMDTSTRFVEAVPLRRATSQAITEALLKFFTLFGLPVGDVDGFPSLMKWMENRH